MMYVPRRDKSSLLWDLLEACDQSPFSRCGSRLAGEQAPLSLMGGASPLPALGLLLLLTSALRCGASGADQTETEAFAQLVGRASRVLDAEWSPVLLDVSPGTDSWAYNGGGLIALRVMEAQDRARQGGPPLPPGGLSKQLWAASGGSGGSGGTGGAEWPPRALVAVAPRTHHGHIYSKQLMES